MTSSNSRFLCALVIKEPIPTARKFDERKIASGPGRQPSLLD